MKNDYLIKSPPLLRDFLLYLENVKARSEKTIYEYFVDLRTFFRFLKLEKNIIDKDSKFNDISILDVDANLLNTVTLTDLYSYLHFLSNTRKNDSPARSRKISSIRTFFDYAVNKMHLVDTNPSEALETPRLKKSLPVFLSLEQSLELLSHINTQTKERDYCIITLFINCGMRLSELIGIDLGDIQQDTVRLLGKGNKERIVYLNDACLQALSDYINVRGRNIKVMKDRNALFLSKNGSRLTPRRVEQIVESCLKQAGLDNMGFSPHKLRHTAATLMYQHGDVDIRVLQKILGHSNLNNTQIYTHVSSKQLKQASSNSPLSQIKRKKDYDDE